jgi:hypothetical protein
MNVRAVSPARCVWPGGLNHETSASKPDFTPGEIPMSLAGLSPCTISIARSDPLVSASFIRDVPSVRTPTSARSDLDPCGALIVRARKVRFRKHGKRHGFTCVRVIEP